MFLDDLDQRSAKSRELRRESERAALDAYYRGVERGVAKAVSRTEPLPHEAARDRELAVLDVGPRVRGVYEKEATWPGTRAFLVIAESGAPLMDVTVPDAVATGRFIHSLYRFLAREDPRPVLKAI